MNSLSPKHGPVHFHVIGQVAPGLRICGQVTHFGLLLSASIYPNMRYPCAWRGVELHRQVVRDPSLTPNNNR